jgi:cytidylate kinase
MIIAIDGPAASGKSTVAKGVARRLGVRYLDTGAMYRAVASLALSRGVDLGDEASLARLAEERPVSFGYAESEPVPTAVYIDGADVTRAIRSPEVDASVSAVARVPGVRAAMVLAQRRLAGDGDTVVEGRDIGTVVFPNAEVKVFLTASAEERARRRTLDLEGAGHGIGEAEVQERLERRDYADSTRRVSPLGVAEDAVCMDTTGSSVEDVVDRIVGLVEAAR